MANDVDVTPVVPQEEMPSLSGLPAEIIRDIPSRNSGASLKLGFFFFFFKFQDTTLPRPSARIRARIVYMVMIDSSLAPRDF